MSIKTLFRSMLTAVALSLALASSPALAQDPGDDRFTESGKAKTPPFGIPDGIVEDMGGEAGINAWVQALFHYILLDYRIAPIFNEFGHIERQIALNTQLEQRVLGKGNEYMGASMAAAHADLQITMEEFNAVVEAAYNACERVNYHYYECNQLIAALAPFTFDIVTN